MVTIFIGHGVFDFLFDSSTDLTQIIFFGPETGAQTSLSTETIISYNTIKYQLSVSLSCICILPCVCVYPCLKR